MWTHEALDAGEPRRMAMPHRYGCTRQPDAFTIG